MTTSQEQAKPFVGWLRNISGHSWWLDNGTDDWTPVWFDAEHDTPINVKIALAVYTMEDGTQRVNPVGKYYDVLPEAPGSADPTHKHVLLLRTIPVGANEKIKKAALARATLLASQAEQYWRYHAEGRWDVRIIGHVLETDCRAEPPMFCGTQMKRRYDELVLELPPEFRPNYFHAVTDVEGTGWCGQATVGGMFGATYRNCGIGTVIHELGHQFGLMHASAEEADGTLSEYGDRSCVMGSSNDLPGLNSPHMLYLGFEDQKEVKILNKSEQVLLAPIELPPHLLRADEYQHILIRQEDQTYYLSVRKQKTPYKVRDEDLVYVHRTGFGRGKNYPRSILCSTLRVGDSYSRDNFKITYLNFANETARLNVELDAVPVSNRVDINSEFPEHTVVQELDQKHYGIWADALYDGQGIEVHVRDERLFVMWYTMALGKSNRRKFYYGTCDMKDAHKGFDLLTASGGFFEQPELAQVRNAGRAQLLFYNESTGVLNFNTEDFGRGSLFLKPVALSNDPRNGLFVPPANRANEGFTIQVFDHLDVCTCFWYTYGSKAWGGDSRWFMCSGPKVGNNAYALTIYEVLNTIGMHVSYPEIKPVGSASLEYVDDEWKLSYDVNAHGSVVSTAKTVLTRLF